MRSSNISHLVKGEHGHENVIYERLFRINIDLLCIAGF